MTEVTCVTTPEIVLSIEATKSSERNPTISGIHVIDQRGAANRNLALGTISFAICFAVWGLISAFAPQFRAELHLTAKSTALLVAVPVLLGSLARIPMGILTDLFGGRLIFTLLMVFSAAAAALIPLAGDYNQLLAFGFLLGMAGSSFAIGIGYVSRWFPPSQQGTALGVYGMGNIGQSAAVFLGPVLAAMVGRKGVFLGMGVVTVLWSGAFLLLARDAPRTKPPAGLGPMLKVLATERLSWALSAFYFLTFGGFVAFSIYLPSLLRDEFHLTAADAGFRTAGFVVLATLMRPAGGVLADRIGGARVLSGVFLGIMPFALLLAWLSMVPFTVGALGCAALLGIGNGAVFKLVPRVLSRQHRDGHGTGGRDGWAGRVLSAAGSGCVSRRDRHRVAGLRPARGHRGGMWLLNRACSFPGSAPRKPARDSASLRADGPASSRRAGDDGHGAAGGGDRRRIAQPAELRPGAGDLHVRGRLRDVGHRLSLRGVAEQAADAPFL